MGGDRRRNGVVLFLGSSRLLKRGVRLFGAGLEPTPFRFQSKTVSKKQILLGLPGKAILLVPRTLSLELGLEFGNIHRGGVRLLHICMALRRGFGSFSTCRQFTPFHVPQATFFSQARLQLADLSAQHSD